MWPGKVKNGIIRDPFWDISTFACREPQKPNNQSMHLAPQLLYQQSIFKIQNTNADQYIRAFYMPHCHYVLHTHCVQ
jgi:hypothetical protein